MALQEVQVAALVVLVHMHQSCVHVNASYVQLANMLLVEPSVYPVQLARLGPIKDAVDAFYVVLARICPRRVVLHVTPCRRGVTLPRAQELLLIPNVV